MESIEFPANQADLIELIESGENVNAKDSEGRTVMHLASENGNKIELNRKKIQLNIYNK